MFVLHIWNFLIVFLLQAVQVIQILMVILVLGFLGHGSIVIIQLLLNLLMRFSACQNGERISQLCLKFSRLWCKSCNIWSICCVTVIWKCAIHMIHEEHVLQSFQACCEPEFLFLVLKIVCDLSLICQRVAHERIDLDWFWICVSDSEWLLLDISVYTKVLMGNLDKTAQSYNKMVLECLYHSFICTRLVHVWWHKLKFIVFILNTLNDDVIFSIVKFLKAWV